ncbi:SRPBCC family protein [Paracrocinitomix mangrovi]|uniref:SRPBCC family protein n=1 Tax=Paracrocinitomix mangrovi TaxID=2862509 RepID=UPI001C8DB483|nr:SRPBCC family protein [Paracrocinitomix mangrovi]UKN03734.1 SRPBCC family protein [Paracrocinitomix mangrovi]
MKNINLNAPVHSVQTISINSNIEKVWEILTEINQWKNWQKDITFAKIQGDPKPNTTFEWKSGGIKIKSRIHTNNVNQVFGWTGKAIGTRAIHNWSLSSQENQTIVEVSESMEGLIPSMFKSAMSKKLHEGLNNWLGYLKDKCEN